MSNKKTNNLEFWDSVEKTDPAFAKKMQHGSRLTAICAQYQVKTATEKWGMYGKTWGLYDQDFKIENFGDEALCIFTANFKYPDGEFPTGSSIIINPKGRTDQDFIKKVQTDCLTKALSKLGFNADVFMGKFDDNKYVSSLTTNQEPKPQSKKKMTDEIVEKMIAAIDSGNLETVKQRMANYEMTAAQKKKLDDKIKSTK